MTANQLQLRVNFSTRELEILGSPDDVREWYDRIEPQISKSTGRHIDGTGAAPPVPRLSNGKELAGERSFGQFLQSFPRNITDVDRTLVAGLFIQDGDADKVFSTGAVSDLLKDQGFKLTNASASVRRNLSAGRIFVQNKGNFRVSQAGVDHLAQLRGAGE